MILNLIIFLQAVNALFALAAWFDFRKSENDDPLASLRWLYESQRDVFVSLCFIIVRWLLGVCIASMERVHLLELSNEAIKKQAEGASRQCQAFMKEIDELKAAVPAASAAEADR